MKLKMFVQFRQNVKPLPLYPNEVAITTYCYFRPDCYFYSGHCNYKRYLKLNYQHTTVETER